MKKHVTNKVGDVTELSRELIAGMRPMKELDPKLVKRFKAERRKRGRPAGRSKAVVSVSLDKDILDALRAGGAGWQTRVNELLRAAVGLSG